MKGGVTAAVSYISFTLNSFVVRLWIVGGSRRKPTQTRGEREVSTPGPAAV